MISKTLPANILLELARQTALGGTALTWETLAPEPLPRLYLTELNGELVIQLKFAYQDLELVCEFEPTCRKPAAQARHVEPGAGRPPAGKRKAII